MNSLSTSRRKTNDFKSYLSAIVKIKLLFLPLAGFAIFIAGLSLPLHVMSIRYILLIAGTLVTLLFYFITLFQVITTLSSDPTNKIFWVVAIVCLPVIGNIIYVIFRGLYNQWQQPHGIY